MYRTYCTRWTMVLNCCIAIIPGSHSMGSMLAKFKMYPWVSRFPGFIYCIFSLSLSVFGCPSVGVYPGFIPSLALINFDVGVSWQLGTNASHVCLRTSHTLWSPGSAFDQLHPSLVHTLKKRADEKKSINDAGGSRLRKGTVSFASQSRTNDQQLKSEHQSLARTRGHNSVT